MILDILFLLLMLYAVFRGLTKGLILGLFSMVTVFIGIAAALKLSSGVAIYLQGRSGSLDRWLPILSFIIVFLAVILLVKVGARIIEKAIQLAMLGWLNRIGGMILFVLLYSFMFSVFLFYAEKMYLVKSQTIAQSEVYPYIAPWGRRVIDNMGRIVPLFKDMFQQLEVFFGNIAQKTA